jgi:amino acid adenylation domain-containing protein
MSIDVQPHRAEATTDLPMTVALREDQIREAKAFWKKQIDCGIPVLQLPTDRSRTTRQSSGCAVHDFVISRNISAGFQSLANRKRTTLASTTLACFATLLQRYSAQNDFVIGTACAGDTSDASSSTYVPLRFSLGDDRTFCQMVEQVGELLRNAVAFANVQVDEPFLSPGSGSQQLFNVTFSLATHSRVADFIEDRDLGLELNDTGDGVAARLVYSAELFDVSTIERMAEHFVTMAAATVESPDQKVSALPMLTAQEQQQLAEWNRTETEYPRGLCVHELVESQVARTPDAIAVEHGGIQLTYRELNERANQLARFLRKRGIGLESRVGICLRRSLELPVALLAVLKAGAACVPLDPAYPKERLSYMLGDSETPLVLSQPGMLSEVTDFEAEVVNLDPDWNLFANESRENVRSSVEPENLAYIIYTSGSTGKPRGVLLPHAGLVNHNAAAAKLFGITSADRMAQFASISFDIAIEEIFPTWIAGGALIVREENASLAVGDFLRWVDENRVTALDLPTAYWHELVRELAESALKLPKSLRLVIVGGEKAQSGALATWRKFAGSRVRWVNTYGPTETSVIVTSYEPSVSEELPAVLPIGRPIANTKIYILNKSLQPLPVGIAGDLYVSGPGLARGYLNRPEITAEKFVADPFSTEPGARMYKTGDLAKYLPNGEIEFAGRTDDQVKIRGYRVELEEIEAVLGAHKGVHEVVVVARENSSGEKNLVAYLVPSREQVPTASELRTYLKQKLPAYMVPAAVVLLEAMPKTPNGKVDKRALPAPKTADFAATQEYVAPTNELESKLASIWEIVLDKKPIGIRDIFFELGGHSLLAARLMHRIEQQLGLRLPLAALLQAPTVEQLARAMSQGEESSAWSSLVALQPQGSRPPFFCVHGVGGNVLGFRDLVRHLGNDQPFYALQPQGLDGKRPCLTSVPHMAARYIEEIRKVQAEGPYRIGGYSFGGLVAYEMARVLEAQGEQVALLALFDSYPGKVETRAEQMKSLMSLPLTERLGFLFKKGTFVLMTLRKRIEMRFLPRALRNVRRACSKAATEYDVKPYSGRVTLFRVREKSAGSLNDPYAIWWRMAGRGVELREISGDHLSLLKEPQVRFLAEELAQALAQSVEKNSLVAAGD